MDRRQGYCLSLSVLYLSVAERIGLKVYGVVVPGHFFVRFDDGRTRFNIETTSGGATSTDEHYTQKFGVPDNGRRTIYMKNLTKQQTLGCFFNNLGTVYNDIGDYDTAMLALERRRGDQSDALRVAANLATSTCRRANRGRAAPIPGGRST